MGQHELVEGLVQGEAVGPPPQGQHEDGGGGVEAVARGEEVLGLRDRAGQGAGVAQVGGLAPLEDRVGVEDSELVRTARSRERRRGIRHLGNERRRRSPMRSAKVTYHGPRADAGVGVAAPVQRIEARRQPPRLAPLGVPAAASSSSSSPAADPSHAVAPVLVERVRDGHPRLVRPRPRRVLVVLKPRVPRRLHHAQPPREAQRVLEDLGGDLVEPWGNERREGGRRTVRRRESGEGEVRTRQCACQTASNGDALTLHGIVAGIVVVPAARGAVGRVGRGVDEVADGLARHLDGQVEGFHVAQLGIILGLGREPAGERDLRSRGGRRRGGRRRGPLIAPCRVRPVLAARRPEERALEAVGPDGAVIGVVDGFRRGREGGEDAVAGPRARSTWRGRQWRRRPSERRRQKEGDDDSPRREREPTPWRIIVVAVVPHHENVLYRALLHWLFSTCRERAFGNVDETTRHFKTEGTPNKGKPI